MTKAKKSLALVLVVVLALSLFPMTAFAAAETWTSGTLKGATITSGTSTAGSATTAAIGTPGSVTLTVAQATNTTDTYALTFSASTNTVAVKKAAAAAGISAATTGTQLQTAYTAATNVTAATTFVDGDYVIIANIDSAITNANTNIWVIKVIVEADATINGVKNTTGATIAAYSAGTAITGTGAITLPLGSVVSGTPTTAGINLGAPAKLTKTVIVPAGNQSTAQAVVADVTGGAITTADLLVVLLYANTDTTKATPLNYYAWTITLANDTAVANGGGTINGDSYAIDVPLQVLVPLSLNFAIDPYEISTTSTVGGQIKSPDYKVINQSDIAVRVQFELTASPAANVALQSATAAVASGTAKNAYLGIISAKSETGTIYAGTGGTYTYDAASTAAADPAIIPFDATSKKAAVAFALDKAAVSGTTIAAASKGVGAFQFFGVVNELAAWADHDLKMTGTYTIKVLLADQLASTLILGLNQISTKPGFVAGTDMSSIDNTTYHYKNYDYAGQANYALSKAKATAGTAKLLFSPGMGTITNVYFGEIAWTTDFADVTSTFTISSNGITFGAGWAGDTNGTKELYIALSTGETYCVHLTVGA